MIYSLYSRASIFRGRRGPLDAHRGSSEARKIEMNDNDLYADRTNTQRCAGKCQVSWPLVNPLTRLQQSADQASDASVVNSTRAGTGRWLTAGVTVNQLAHMDGNNPTNIQATAETGGLDYENSREAAGSV